MKDISSSSNGLPSASTDTRNVEDDEASDTTGSVTARTPAAATATNTPTVLQGVGNVPDPPDTAPPSPTKRPHQGRGGFRASKGQPVPNVPDPPDTASRTPTQRQAKRRGRFQASKGHPGGNPMVDVDDDQCRRSVSDVEAVVPSPEPTAPSTTSAAPIWDAYLAPEIVDAVVWDNADSQRSDRRKWALLFAGVLLVGAVIVVVAMSEFSWTRNKNMVNNDPPSSAPTTILSSTGRLGEILREIMTHFESPTLEQDLKNLQSPQYLAALWMAEEDAHPATANLTYPLNQTSFDLLQFRQRYALATFYYATGGDEWKDPCNFLSPSLHVCDWNCEWDSGPYESLDFFYKFTDFFLNGTTMGALCGRSVQNVSEIMPPPVLDDLVLILFFANNALTTTIPDEIQGLDVLKAFSMSFQFLSGTLPLDALANTMVAKQPELFADQLGTNHYLETIFLENTTVSGTLSSTIGNLPSLRSMWLINNLFSGTIPSAIGLMTSLDYVDVSEAFNGTIPPEIFNMPSLEVLVLDSGQLTGTIPEPNRTVPLLSALMLNGNRLTGTIPKDMDKFPNLLFLELQDNLLTGEVPTSVGELVNLYDLNLSNNLLSGKLLEQPFLYNFSGLVFLTLDNNLFSGTISTDIGLLSTLWVVTMNQNELTGTVPTELALLSIINSLDLSGNRLTGSIPTEIAQIPLYALALNHNELTGTFPTELALLSNIDFLWLDGNSITGSLESFCSAFINGTDDDNPYFDYISIAADCLEDTVNCSCCTKCCDEDNYCREEIAR